METQRKEEEIFFPSEPSRIEKDLPIDAELKAKIDKIKSIHIGYEQLANLILVIAGVKPAQELSVFTWNTPPEEIEKILDEIGISHKRKIRESKEENKNKIAEICVAKDEHILDLLLQYNADHDHKEYGLLMGYPATAVEAFMTKDFLPRDQYPPDETRQYFVFKLSKKHWQEELRTVASWRKIVEQYAPELFV